MVEVLANLSVRNSLTYVPPRYSRGYSSHRITQLLIRAPNCSLLLRVESLPRSLALHIGPVSAGCSKRFIVLHTRGIDCVCRSSQSSGAAKVAVCPNPVDPRPGNDDAP